MNSYLILAFIFVILLVLELAYFKIADKFNIIDKPNERSSHSMIVLRGVAMDMEHVCFDWYSWCFGFVSLVSWSSFIDCWNQLH